MKRKIISAALALSAALSAFVPTFAAQTEKIKYLKSDEPYNYGSDYVYLAADKATGEIIPLSVGPFDGYTYAYMPNGNEIEERQVMPETFTDVYVGSEWINVDIEQMSARGVFTGFDDGAFHPEEELTRAQMAAVFARLFSVEPSDKPSCFSDVTAEDWSCGYIMALVDRGVFLKDEKFNPDEKVTREQLIAMTYRMLSDMGYVQDAGEYAFSQYRDTGDVSEYAKKAYNGMLVNGYRIICDMDEQDMMDFADDEYFLFPQKSVTRYDCAEYLYDFVHMFIYNNAPAIKRGEAPDIEIPVLDGSTSTYEITSNIFCAFYENAQNHPDMPKAHSKTSNSYKRLIDGEVEMIFVPDPSEEIKDYAKEKGVELKYIPIANEALIFFTGKDNKADNITTEQVYDIYVNNGIKNWSVIGGEDKELVPYCRNNDSGSHAQMEKFVLDGKDINEQIEKEHTSWMMSSILTEVDDFNRENPDKYAMGYSLYYYYINNEMIVGPLDLKLMKINGVAPTEETIGNGTYPYTTNYYAVIRDEQNPKVEAFAELMQGEFGRQIMRMSGMGAIE